MPPIPQGLHLGLAAWIHQTGLPAGFLAVPADPITFDPRSILPFEVSLNSFQQAEISRMVSLVPHKGQPADVFGAGAPVLWERLPGVLHEMIFARRALTPAQAQAQDDAKRVLYTRDSPAQLSTKYRAYLEMRRVVQDLLMTGATADQLTEAYADWEGLGYKSEVERALAVIVLAGQISSAEQATAMQGALDPTRLSYAGDQKYAPSYFAPLSAADPSTWTTARVSLADLSASLSATPTQPGAVFVAASQATCEFAYAALTVIRPWFAPEIFEHDDWCLADAQAIVSSGDGRSGLLPAYAAVMYVARVLSISGAPAPVAPPPSPVVRPAGKPGSGPVATGRLAGPASSSPGGAVFADVRPARMSAAPLGARADGPGTPLRVLQGGAVLPSGLRRTDWLARLAWLQQLGREPLRDTTTQTGTTGPQIVGFGCVPVPPAPHPNPLYVW